MIMLDWSDSARQASGVALIFGAGLVGGAALRALKHALPGARERQFAWTWTNLSAAETNAVEAAARDALSAQTAPNLSVIWAAGRGGFGSDSSDMDQEFQSFQKVIGITKRIGDAVPANRRKFIHVSSAGGLFEGQVGCNAFADPAPLRPYGEGKLAQEHLVHAEGSLGQRHILRPSSVYGYAPTARRGLIAALVAAAIHGRPATIMGALTTQRDYIYAADIGRFIAERVLADSDTETRVETALLASGRPAAIFEVLHLIEARLGKPLLLRIDPNPENARDNTFLRSALPQGFQPTQLFEGIALTAATVASDRQSGAIL